MKGIIQKDGSVIAENGKTYWLDFRGTDSLGYPEVLIDAKAVGGKGWMQRQSILPLIGMTVQFALSYSGTGYNYEILKQQQ